MDPKALMRQVIDVQKSTFTNSFNAIEMMQDQYEKMMNTFLGQAPWIPSDARKALGDWVGSCKKAREDFKRSMDENFARLEEYFTSTDKPQSRTRRG
ncbi:MAG TPA: hypothetical protein PLW83_05090 [Deltaproteobacteria bacterium]|nr:hypothetical protein [Deltaproteobacteria bacterium]